MSKKIIVAAIVTGAVAVSLSLPAHATLDPSQTCEPPASEERMRTETAADSRGGEIVVPVVIHVIRKDRTVDGGNVPGSWIRGQVDVLDASFSGELHGADARISFELIDVERVTNPDWFVFDPQADGRDERQMKRQLRVGGSGTLNIYTVKTQRYAGEGTFPRFYDSKPWDDGVVVWFRTLPGGGAPGKDQGDTAVHEIGHWLNLLHTYEDGCGSPGDRVDDTPAHERPDIGTCDPDTDTCPVFAGNDPVRNFMSNGNDACIREFTDGQGVRMRDAWFTFRAA